MFWPDTGTGVDVEPARKPVDAAVRKFFTEGGVGVRPSIPGAEWFNQITNEVLNVLADAGINPSKVEDDQLLDAIKRVSNSISAREALRRSYAEAGYNLVAGDFETGGIVTEVADVLLSKSTGHAYSWCGSLPKNVPDRSSPESTGGVNANAWNDASAHISTNPDRHAAVIQAMASGSPVKICVVGDSITNGITVDTPYPYRLGEILREWYNNPNIEIIKRGYSGHDTKQVLDEHISEIIADYADLYLIALGVNDARQDRNITVDMYEQALRTMYNRLSFAAVSFCSLTDVVGLQASEVTNPYAISAYRSRMKHVAQTSGARYIDSFSIMQRYLFKRGDARGRLQRDRLHWDQDGYNLIAEAIFMDGFAGVNLEIEPNQFIDNTTSAYRGSANVLNTLNCPYSVFVKTPELSASKLFIFNSSLKPAYLLAHFAVALTDTGLVEGQVTVKNSVETTGRTYTIDIANATGIPSNYLSESPTAVCDLAPGLNVITFSTASLKVCRVVGFTVKEYQDSYSVAMREKAKIGSKIVNGFLSQSGFVNNTKFYKELKFNKLASNQSITSDSATDFVMTSDICTLSPNTYGETRFRIRGNFGANCKLHIGYQIKSSEESSDWRSDYVPVFTLDFWGTQTFMILTAFTGTPVTIGNISNPYGNQCIDIITSEAGTQFYINGILLWSIAIKLPECTLYASSSYNSLSDGVVIESVAEVGSLVVPNAVVAGEKWYTHADNKMHIVNSAGVQKTVQFS